MTDDISYEIQQLREQISHHNRLYHQLDSPTLSDTEYDALFERLLQLEKQYPQYACADSPTQTVGAPALSELQKVHHQQPMLSLGNIFSVDDYQQWCNRLSRELGYKPQLVAEPKLDGVAIRLIYEQGKLTLAATRGDGTTGEDVTHTIHTIRDIPAQLKGTFPAHVEIRGEVFMTLSGFAKFNKRMEKAGKKTFANPRNSTAGSIRQLDASMAAERPLTFYAYALTAPTDALAKTHSQAMERIHAWGVPVNPLLKVGKNSHQIKNHYHMLQKKRAQLDYEIDGMVIKANRLAEQQELGFLSRSPRWAVAWKFPPQQVESTLLAVDFQVGRSGVLTPVARLKPVRIGGVTVSNATLHNIDELARLDIALGDTVQLIRAGDVIPKIRASIPATKRKPVILPTNCPVCQSPLEQIDGASTRLVCSGSLACRAQLHQKLFYFASREAMNIDGLGLRQIEVFVDKGYIKHMSDIYRLKNHAHKIQQLENFGERSTQLLLDAIERSKQTTMARFITALGINNVGRITAERLAQHFTDVHQLMTATAEQLVDIRDIGPIVAQSIRDFFTVEGNIQTAEQLVQCGLTFPAPVSEPGAYSGKKAVITGSLSLPRNEFAQLLKNAGIEVTTSVSSKTNWLVYGDNPGSKLAKAKKLNVTLLSEQQMRELLV